MSADIKSLTPVVDLSPESLAGIYQHCPDHIIKMLQNCWLSPTSTRVIFDIVRGCDADMVAICKICISDTRAYIRALAFSELINVLPYEEARKSLWA